MSLAKWDAKFREQPDTVAQPTPLVVRTVEGLPPGEALDLACGAGGNAGWLADHGWRVTAVDGSSAAIDIVRRRAAGRIETRVADLEKHEYTIEPARWDLIVMTLYLQRDLFAPALTGLRPGGLLIASVLAGSASGHRLRSGELSTFFPKEAIVHLSETDTIAEIVVRRS